MKGIVRPPMEVLEDDALVTNAGERVNEPLTLHQIADSLDPNELAMLAQQFDGAVGQVAQDARMNELKKAFLEQGVAVILGAGVSMDAGAPSWGQLMGRLVLSVVHGKLEPGAPVSDAYLPFTELLARTLPTDQLIVAHYTKRALDAQGLDGDKQFVATLRQVLYARGKDPRDSPLLNALAQVCRGSSWQKAKGVRQLITYNYDVFVEEVLAHVKCPHETIRRHERASGTHLPVYHPHGILHRVAEKEDWVILSEDDYHREFAAPHSWSNIVQLNAFSQMRCVFVGLSMIDPNIRRLLGAAKTRNAPQHFAFLRRRNTDELLHRLEKEHGWGVGNPGGTADALRERVRVGCLGGDVADDLTLEALGVQVIWYDEHANLPALLSELLK
jgi:hypothetical protein